MYPSLIYYIARRQMSRGNFETAHPRCSGGSLSRYVRKWLYSKLSRLRRGLSQFSCANATKLRRKTEMTGKLEMHVRIIHIEGLADLSTLTNCYSVKSRYCCFTSAILRSFGFTPSVSMPNMRTGISIFD